MHQPTYLDIYCAGFIADKPVISGLFVVTGEEGGLKQLYSTRDTIFLSHGAGYIVNEQRASLEPGGALDCEVHRALERTQGSGALVCLRSSARLGDRLIDPALGALSFRRESRAPVAFDPRERA